MNRSTRGAGARLASRCARRARAALERRRRQAACGPN